MATIVFVDDEPSWEPLITLVFQRLLPEHHLVTFWYPQDALDYVVANPPDLLITDDFMPDIHGVELCYHLLEIKTLRAIPVILKCESSLRYLECNELPSNLVDFWQMFTGPETLAAMAKGLLDEP